VPSTTPSSEGNDTKSEVYKTQKSGRLQAGHEPSCGVKKVTFFQKGNKNTKRENIHKNELTTSSPKMEGD